MPFKSARYRGEFHIDDKNYREHAGDVVVAGQKRARGYVPRDWDKEPLGFLCPAYEGPIIPRDEWAERIEEMERTKTRLSDLLLQAKIPSTDQDGLPYCWGYAVTTCIHTIRCLNGLPYLDLSSESVCAQVTGYRKVGGWSGNAQKWVIQHGIATAEFWPHHAVNRKYATDAMRADALKRRFTEWDDLRNGDFDAMMTMLLRRRPVAAGLSWWRHAIAFIDPIVLGRNSFGVRFRNSWSDRYGSKGFSTLTESKARGDYCTARVTMASVT